MRSLALVTLFVAVAHAQAPTASPAPATPAAPIDLSVDGKSSTIVYGLVHKLHKFEGTSHAVEGKARLLPNGQAQVMVRAPVESFDSGNTNRDAHMKEVVEAVRFGFVEVKAVGDAHMPAVFPTSIQKTFKAQVSFHGVQQLLDVPVRITFESPRRITAEATFEISLDASKVERPSLLFVKVEDAVKVVARIAFTR